MRMNRLKLYLAVSVLLSAAFMLNACGNAAESSRAASLPGDDIRIIIPEETAFSSAEDPAQTAESTAESAAESTAESAESTSAPAESTAAESTEPLSTEETRKAPESSTEGTTAAPQPTSAPLPTGSETKPLPTETTSAPTEAPVPENPYRDYFRNTVFVGDSRTLCLSSGGALEYRLLDEASVSASWGGKADQESAMNNAENAAARKPAQAVFWYGVNDAQSTHRDDAEYFIGHYAAVIDCFAALSPESRISVLSILDTSVLEQDYYEGQEENIRRYNEAIRSLCEARGWQYLDITALFTGEDTFAANDHIHFSKTWYEKRFLPAVKLQLA